MSVKREWLAPLPRLLLTLFLLVLIVHIMAGRGTDTSLTRVQQAGELVVAMDASYPPFEMTDGQGNYGGFDADVAREIARRLGVGVRFANIAFDSLYDALASRTADVVISGLRYERERTRDVIYTASYIDVGQVLLVRSADAISKTADMAGRRVAVETASEGEVEARKLAAKIAGMRIQEYETPPEMATALHSQQVDAAVTDLVTARGLAKSQPGLRLILPPFVADPLVIAGDSLDRTLMAEISRVLGTMRDEGVLDRLADTWF
jgi:polar amino acid transport system substrate-binding protein